MTQRWQDGEITNFEYLMHLNKQAGRTFNDLMQYPVLPFILADYKSTNLDLNNEGTFRNLAVPMAIQDNKLREHFVQRYTMLKREHSSPISEDHVNNSTPPYHYGSHYSNSGIVLHYLVRLLPFAKLFIEFQGGSFDIPDRTFHNLKTTWRLASSESTTDVRELIPEFFYLPEMFHNSEGFNFGERQNGSVVNDVIMPTWANHDRRLFVLKHRMSLESEYVSQNLHKWIDLVFGYKQQGQAAIEAINVFHPSTYFGIDVEKIENKLHREAMKTMVKTYGQTPRQLFRDPHVTRHAMAHIYSKPLTTKGAPMQQGGGQKMASRFWKMAFTSTINEALAGIDRERELIPGTVHFSNPILCWTAKFPYPISSIRCLPSGEVISLPPCTSYLAFVTWRGPRYEQVSSFYDLAASNFTGITLKWGSDQGTTDLISENSILFSISNTDVVTCCSNSRDGRVFAIGYSTGLVAVWPVMFDLNTQNVSNIGPARYLNGHLVSVTTLQINRAFSIIISADVTGRVIIWDLNLMTYVKYFDTRSSPVSCVRISDTLGDIVTVSSPFTTLNFPGLKHKPNDTASVIYLHTVNGAPTYSARCNHKICSVSISVMPEGLYKNIIATGFDNGVIWLWNTWDLTVVSEIRTNYSSPIISLEFSHDSYSLAAGSEDGRVMVWTQADPTNK